MIKTLEFNSGRSLLEWVDAHRYSSIVDVSCRTVDDSKQFAVIYVVKYISIKDLPNAINDLYNSRADIDQQSRDSNQ